MQKIIYFRLVRRLKGFHALDKGRHVTAALHDLTDAEFCLFELYTDLFIWDKSHFEEYRRVLFSDRNIATLLKWSPSKVCRVRKSLILKGLMTEVERGFYEVDPIFESKIDSSKAKHFVAGIKPKILRTNRNVSLTQQQQAQKDADSLLSFKSNSVSSPDDTDLPF